MTGISKWYPSSNVVANDRVDFSADEGEVHALVGENGAGKSTLMRILYGQERADCGEIRLGGSPVTIRSPRDAQRLGIGMVPQAVRLVPGFTVAENVVLGSEPVRGGLLLDVDRARETVREAGRRTGLAVDPMVRAADLDVGQAQAVEILRLLAREARLLILDEPTAVLTAQQTERLFATIRGLARDGRTVVLITHKVEDVSQIADRVTVMRDGRRVATLPVDGSSPREIARLMVGEKPLPVPPSRQRTPGRAVLELRDIRVAAPAGSGLRGVSFAVRAGEVTAVTGVSGSGLRELEDVVAGMIPVGAGEILHDGRHIDRLSRSGHRRELAYVPSQRLYRGASLKSTVAENLLLGRARSFSRLGVFRRAESARYVGATLREFGVSADPDLPMEMLSGGNRQRVVLARELASEHDLVLFAEPTWGVDMAGTSFVHHRIALLREEGRAVLLISSDVDEVLSLADRILILRGGRIVGRLAGTDGVSRAVLGEYMLGLREDAA